MNSPSNLEYFRKQAKRLHRAAASRDADALRTIERNLRDPDQLSLTKCQHVIAQEHGFTCWENLVQAKELERSLAITWVRVAQLNDFGIGIFDGHRNLPLDERRRIFQDNRRRLRENIKDVARTHEWLVENLSPVKTLSRPLSSYFLKHVAERDIGYISNGVFIAAAIIARYPYRIYVDSPNVGFAVSRRSLKAIAVRQRRE